jgi:hypothetical protein
MWGGRGGNCKAVKGRLLASELEPHVPVIGQSRHRHSPGADAAPTCVDIAEPTHSCRSSGLNVSRTRINMRRDSAAQPSASLGQRVSCHVA